MATKVTQGIKISVVTQYRERHSNPVGNHFVFSYRITIENQNGYPVQLLRRHWYIFDAVGVVSEVEGEGVVGQQPIIQPGEKYTYDSACNLTTRIGRMHGTYLMTREFDNKTFYVDIPPFELILPYILN